MNRLYWCIFWLCACATWEVAHAIDTQPCISSDGVLQERSQVVFDNLYDKRTCTDLDIEGDFCSTGASPTDEYYQVDFVSLMDYNEGVYCSSDFTFDSVQIGGALETPGFCNGSLPGTPSCATITGSIKIEVTINNIRYKRILNPGGQVPYDSIILSQPVNFWDLTSSLGEPQFANIACMSECVNGSQSCLFRANDINGSYCFNQNTQVADAAGPTGYNCIGVQQNVFYAGDYDLTVSCCGDCQDCSCNGTNPATAFFPQVSPSSLYDQYINTNTPFVVDTNAPGTSGNMSNNALHPVLLGANGWPSQPTMAGRDYYDSLNNCSQPNCIYEQGGWFAPLRRLPTSSLTTLANDISGKLACGFCSQGPLGRIGCGTPFYPGVTGVQSWLMGMTPMCTLYSAMDEASLVGDLSITITTQGDQVYTINVPAFDLENQVYPLQTPDGLLYVEITRDFTQSPLDDPLVLGSLIGACAPDALGQDYSPFDPDTWSDPANPWAGRDGIESGLPDCFGCLPDDQSQNGQRRLWWMMNSTQADSMFDLSNTGSINNNGITNAIWQGQDCNNPPGNASGCAVGVLPGTRAQSCFDSGGAFGALPNISPIEIAQAFENYRAILANAQSKEIDPLFMSPGPYLPPFYNYKAPNVWLENQDESLYLVYRPISSPFDTTVQQTLGLKVVFNSNIVGTSTPVPPVVEIAQDFSFCNLITTNSTAVGGGTIALLLSSALVPPPTTDPNILYSITAQLSSSLDDVSGLSCKVNTFDSFVTRLSYTAGTTISVECRAPQALQYAYALESIEITASVGSIVAGSFPVVICPGEFLTGYVPDSIGVATSAPLDTWVSNYTIEDVPFNSQDGPGGHYTIAEDLYSQTRGTQQAFTIIIIVGSAVAILLGLALLIVAAVVTTRNV